MLMKIKLVQSLVSKQYIKSIRVICKVGLHQTESAIFNYMYMYTWIANKIFGVLLRFFEYTQAKDGGGEHGAELSQEE